MTAFRFNVVAAMSLSCGLCLLRRKGPVEPPPFCVELARKARAGQTKDSTVPSCRPAQGKLQPDPESRPGAETMTSFLSAEPKAAEKKGGSEHRRSARQVPFLSTCTSRFLPPLLQASEINCVRPLERNQYADIFPITHTMHGQSKAMASLVYSCCKGGEGRVGHNKQGNL